MRATLLEDALALDSSAKVQLIESLNASLLAPEQRSILHTWAAESQHRYEEYLAGLHATVDYEAIKRKRP